MKSIREQFGNWCVNFNGVQHDTCKAGIAYADHATAGLPGHRSCFKDQGPHTCPSCRFPTEAEIDAEVDASALALREFLDRVAKDECPHCGHPVDRRVQVGRCVYAEPCGHRMYQGRA